MIDQYVNNPQAGWPLWMANRIRESDYVIIVFSESYFKSLLADNSENIKKKGARIEGIVLYQENYENGGLNNKVIPVVFKEKDKAFIPIEWTPYTYHILDGNKSYKTLYRRITNQEESIPDVGDEVNISSEKNISDDDLYSLSGSGRKNDTDTIVETERATVPIELKLDMDMSNFTDEERMKLLKSIENLLDIRDVKIIKVRKGSVYVTVEVPPHLAEKLLLYAQNGYLGESNVVDAQYGQTWSKEPQGNRSTWIRQNRPHSDTTNETEQLNDIIRQIEKNMVALPGGIFRMGDEDNGPVHDVTLGPFAIGAMPVTQAQYEKVMGNNPSRFKGDDLPVEKVTWNDAAAFCKKLSEITGKQYRLPTEAQWEYACRGGSTTAYCFGDDEKLLDEYCWYKKNSEGITHPVGKKNPNKFGLYDMHGNVWEWCSDWYGDYPSDSIIDPAGPEEGEYRVLRGGSWSILAKLCRSAFRLRFRPENRGNRFGFRLSRGQEQ